jgi:two-component system, NarL family, nitrate/nitrite response regulator NarL
MRNKMPEASTSRIRIVAIDEHEMFRAGLSLILSQQTDFEVVGSAATVPDALPIVQRERPDIVLVSIGGNGAAVIEHLPEILAASQSTKILALSESGDEELFRKAVRFGAAGVLSKNKPAAMLVKAVECVNAGEAWLDRATTASLLRELSPGRRGLKQDPEEMKIASLTEREQEVIRLVGKGLKNKQIAETLFISGVTVHHHLTSIYSKLEVADRMELLIYAYRNGLATLPC